MGGGIELLEAALRVPPWQPLYQLSRDEIQGTRLGNVDRPFDWPAEGVATTAALGASAPPGMCRDQMGGLGAVCRMGRALAKPIMRCRWVSQELYPSYGS